MKDTLKLLKLNEHLIHDAQEELKNIEDLPYYEIMRAYTEMEQDKSKIHSRIRHLENQRLAILEKLEMQIQEEKKQLQNSITNVTAA